VIALKLLLNANCNYEQLRLALNFSVIISCSLCDAKHVEKKVIYLYKKIVFQAKRTFSFIRELQSIAVKQIAFEYRLNTFEHDVSKSCCVQAQIFSLFHPWFWCIFICMDKESNLTQNTQWLINRQRLINRYECKISFFFFIFFFCRIQINILPWHSITLKA